LRGANRLQRARRISFGYIIIYIYIYKRHTAASNPFPSRTWSHFFFFHRRRNKTNDINKNKKKSWRAVNKKKKSLDNRRFFYFLAVVNHSSRGRCCASQRWLGINYVREINVRGGGDPRSARFLGADRTGEIKKKGKQFFKRARTAIIMRSLMRTEETADDLILS